MKMDETKKYEVFVTELCEGNLKDCKKMSLNNDHRRSIIDQLLYALEELDKLDKKHNDIKPGNLLYDIKANSNGFNIRLKLSDFGTCNMTGGTPGWSVPAFNEKIYFGDRYSVGLVILYLLCENDELFYAIRDNCVQPKQGRVYSTEETEGINEFRRIPVVRIIRQMIDPFNTSPLDYFKSQWKQTSLELITFKRLVAKGIAAEYLKLKNGSVRDRERLVV